MVENGHFFGIHVTHIACVARIDRWHCPEHRSRSVDGDNSIRVKSNGGVWALGSSLNAQEPDARFKSNQIQKIIPISVPS